MKNIQELDECRKISLKIKENEQKISELRLSVIYPPCQQYSNIPKGTSGSETAIDKYLIRLEEKENKLNALRDKLEEKWSAALDILKNCGSSTEEIRLMYLRFYQGYSWNKCKSILEWNENKVFRTYRKILIKYTKKYI